MANPGGGNQFGSYQLQPAYGDVARQTELMREAPISGAPVSGRALGTPKRSQKQTQRRQKAGASPAPAPAPSAPPQPQAQTPFNVAQAWAEIAALPGANDAIRLMAQKATQAIGQG